MNEVAPLPCVRFSHEGEGRIVISHPAGQLRFDPDGADADGLVVRTGLMGGAVKVPAVTGGLSLDSMSYTLRGRRWMRRARQAAVIQVTLPGGYRVVHLGTALGSDCSAAWMEDALARFSGAQWLLVGVPSSACGDFVERLRQFNAEQFLMLDLNAAGLLRRLDRSAHIAPFVDRALATGMSATSMAARVSVRFDLK